MNKREAEGYYIQLWAALSAGVNTQFLCGEKLAH